MLHRLSRTSRLGVWRRTPTRDCVVALVPPHGSYSPSVGLPSIHRQRLSEDLPWARPKNGTSDCVKAKQEVQSANPFFNGAEFENLDSGAHAAVSLDAEALVARLQADPELCRRVAGAVDPATAEHWACAREDATTTASQATSVPQPEAWQFWYLHVRTAVPFFGFGFFDNMIMLTVGGAIESTIGVAMGISTLAAAGLGQMVSDASGITLQGLIEGFADKLGLPQPRMTLEQQQLASVKSFVLASRILGIVTGCCFGMFPLLLIPEKKTTLVEQIAEALPAPDRVEFESLVHTRTLKAGDSLLQCGDMSTSVFLIESGEVDCIGRDYEGMPFHVCTLGAGHSFGYPDCHISAQLDLIAKDGPVVVKCIEKADFVRTTGQKGLEVWEAAHPVEHAVYFKSQGRVVLPEF